MSEYDDEETPTRRFRLMHFTMVMLCLLFISKVSDVMTAAHELFAVRDASASSAKKSEEPAPKHEAEAAPAEDAHGEAKEESDHGEEGKHGEEAPAEEMTHGTGKHSVKEIEEMKAGEDKEPYTQSELDLLQNLTKRREELDTREKEIELKSKVLEATEKRINDKVNEMKVLQADLTKVVAEYNKHQDAEIMSLVKIYENMKPLDAAAIFNEMDMPILLEVIDKMSERKVAPVLAGMDPRRARDVTQELAAMRRGRSRIGADGN